MLLKYNTNEQKKVMLDYLHNNNLMYTQKHIEKHDYLYIIDYDSK